jgi:hypothetical protein
MAGLVPAIHVFAIKEGVDAWHKAGHDEKNRMSAMVAPDGVSSSENNERS